MKSYTRLKKLTWAAVISFGFQGILTPAEAALIPSTTVITGSPTITLGDTDTFTAFVIPEIPVTPLPTGTVTFSSFPPFFGPASEPLLPRNIYIYG
jgi:hypothetical protein